jgi:hypothetical protein
MPPGPPGAWQGPSSGPLTPFKHFKLFPGTMLAMEGEHMATSAERMRALRERAILHDNSEAHTGILDITVKPPRGGKHGYSIDYRH